MKDGTVGGSPVGDNASNGYDVKVRGPERAKRTYARYH
jgi:hypothetical protein